MLDGKRILVTGVMTADSIAFASAQRAQELGAEVVLTGFGRARRLTERAARRLPSTPDVLELDVNAPDDLAAVRATLEERWGGVDGVVHAIAFAPPDAARRELPRHAARERRDRVPDQRLLAQGAGRGPCPAAARGRQPRRAGLRRLGGLAGLRLDGRLQGGARGGQPLPGPRPRPAGRARQPGLGRAAADPAASGIPGFDDLAGTWERQAPLGWDVRDPAPVADTVCFLLSEGARRISGEIVHVDGGFHAVGATA